MGSFQKLSEDFALILICELGRIKRQQIHTRMSEKKAKNAMKPKMLSLFVFFFFYLFGGFGGLSVDIFPLI